MKAKENFRPLTHQPPVGIIKTLKFYTRLLVNFQMNTIFGHLKKIIPQYRGKVLDVGCGNSPFQFLIDSERASYIGIDIATADDFDYFNPNKISFDGENLPFSDESIDNIISTEVLEHIEDPQKIISEMYRVLINGGNAVITIPWSARVHYIPYDYCRYTPYKLNKLFAAFNQVSILNRGTDINSIIAKMIVVYVGFVQNIVKFKRETEMIKLIKYGLLSLFSIFYVSYYFRYC